MVAFQAWRTGAEKELAEGHFKMDPKHVEMMEAEPQKFAQEVLPQLAAKVYLDTVTAAVSAIQSYLPQYMEGILLQRTEAQKAEDEFFGAWKQLDKTQHLAKVMEIGQTFRAMNPKASKEDYIKTVGAMAVLQLGLPLVADGPPAPAAAAAPAQRPFVPVGTSGPRAAPAPSPNGNIFASPALDLSAFADEE